MKYKLSYEKVLSGRKKYKRAHTLSGNRRSIQSFGNSDHLQAYKNTFKTMIYGCVVKEDPSVFNALTATRYSRN